MNMAINKKGERMDFGQVGIESSYPVHHEIGFSSNDVSVNLSDVGSRVKKLRTPDVMVSVPDDYPKYAQIDIVNEPSSPKSNTITQPPTSIYSLNVADSKHAKIALKSREVSSRQCKFEIGEEWEQFQIHGKTSVSCPPSPLIGGRRHLVQPKTNLGYAASEPGAEIDQDLTDASKDPFPLHFLFSSHSRNGPKEHHIIPNPFNKTNHRFHSTLQCPCFLFFFFLCCLPAVHLMQQSDRQFKKGNRTRAKNYGSLSTAMYIIGSVVGVAFLAVCIYFAADYVRQFL